jgi:hypothetical protein
MQRSAGVLRLVSVVAMVLTASCGGQPDGIISRVDERATTDSAKEANFKYCKIVSDKFCQSPDSSLVFHLPIDLLTRLLDRVIDENIVVSNQGEDSIVIDKYYVMMIDDRGNTYNPNFRGPNNYDAYSEVTPALVLQPGDKKDINFSQQLDPNAKSIQAVRIFYRLAGEKDFTQVVVSYRPQNIYDLQ